MHPSHRRVSRSRLAAAQQNSFRFPPEMLLSAGVAQYANPGAAAGAMWGKELPSGEKTLECIYWPH